MSDSKIHIPSKITTETNLNKIADKIKNYDYKNVAVTELKNKKINGIVELDFGYVMNQLREGKNVVILLENWDVRPTGQVAVSPKVDII